MGNIDGYAVFVHATYKPHSLRGKAVLGVLAIQSRICTVSYTHLDVYKRQSKYLDNCIGRRKKDSKVKRKGKNIEVMRSIASISSKNSDQARKGVGRMPWH